MNVIIGYNGVGKINYMEFLSELLSLVSFDKFLDYLDWAVKQV
jgi:recombinational DNA repair ATPase RecF